MLTRGSTSSMAGSYGRLKALWPSLNRAQPRANGAESTHRLSRLQRARGRGARNPDPVTSSLQNPIARGESREYRERVKNRPGATKRYRSRHKR